jgi:hypothetical protein
VWDTKHLARSLPQLFRGRSTSLGDIYEALLGGGMRAQVRLFWKQHGLDNLELVPAQAQYPHVVLRTWTPTR